MTKTVEANVRKLSPGEQEQLRERLENLIEDRLEMTEEFKAEITAGKQDISQGGAINPVGRPKGLAEKRQRTARTPRRCRAVQHARIPPGFGVRAVLCRFSFA